MPELAAPPTLVESRINRLMKTLAPSCQARYIACSVQRAWLASGAPAGFGGLLSHQLSVAQSGCRPGRTVPALSAPRSTRAIRSRSGLEASPGLMAERAAPPLVLIGWWAKTSNLAGAGQSCVLT